MKQVTLNIAEDQFSFFMKLVHALDFVQVADKQDSSGTDKSYNSDFVSKIQQSQQEFEDGDFIRVEKENLKEFLGL